MRKLLIAALVVAALVVVLIVVIGGEEDEGTYKIRGVFENGSFVVPDIDVRVAGANVGHVDSVDVSMPGETVGYRENGRPYDQAGKAVVVMEIDDPGFQDFRRDASCLIRPQSLIGEKFIDCSVTRPGSGDFADKPKLKKVPEGEPGAGQYLLPVENNGTSVDLDLINNIYRAPYDQRFRLILSELGIGLAGRGKDLNETIRKANPALREFNRVLAILASENDRLAELARNGSNNLTRLAEKRESIMGFMRGASQTASVGAELSDQVRSNLRNLPATLREVRLTTTELGNFAEAGIPVFSALAPRARQISEVTTKLGPFAEATEISLTSLGDATRTAGPDLVAANPIITRLGRLARAGRSPSRNLNALLSSTREESGFENLMKVIYNLGGIFNGFDSLGHYQRSLVVISGCTEYNGATGGCPSNWSRAQSASVGMEEILPELDDELLPGVTGATGVTGTDVGVTGMDAPLAPGATGSTGDTGSTGTTEEGDASAAAGAGALDYLLGP